MESSFQTIIVGTDGSPHADVAVRAAGELAASIGDCEVHVVSACHAVSESDLQDLLNHIPQEFWDTVDLHEKTWRVLDEAKRILLEHGIEAEAHLIEASPVDALIDVAERVGADLIVVGRRGLGPGRRILLGSVSTKLVHHSPCAVLVASSPDRK